MDVNRYRYDEKRGLPICTKTPQCLSKLEKQRLKEHEEASREKIAANTRSDVQETGPTERERTEFWQTTYCRCAAVSTPRQPTSTRLQQNLIAAAKDNVVVVSSSDDESDNESPDYRIL